ncbi:site-specific integrase [Saccharothrix deserti]|uniref:site-specific integrase n=1 Tax=Saccharothrix deserti TaxID=2593674 RepID=UPI00192E45A5|nr:site-specific integrase [Saccharothrix deserti]
MFWVPQDAVRSGVRRRLLAGWEDLPSQEDAVGVRAGDPIFLSPDYHVDPHLGEYGRWVKFRDFTKETKRNYATDIRLFLDFLWSRGRGWTAATTRDVEDYEHWRRQERSNPQRVGGLEVGSRAGGVVEPVQVTGRAQAGAAKPDRGAEGRRPRW